MLEHLEVETGTPAELSVIWLHGLGADGYDFEPIVPVLGLDGHNVRFVFPHAPVRPVTINAGMRMRAWYDVKGLALSEKQDEPGIRGSAEDVTALIARENERGIPAGKIVLAGFSQGGAIALHVALRLPERLAGLMALSTYLVLEDSLEGEATEANRTVPIFQAHGSADPLVVLERGERARTRLTKMGYAVEWHSYPMGHEVCPDEIRDIAGWLGGVLP